MRKISLFKVVVLLILTATMTGVSVWYMNQPTKFEADIYLYDSITKSPIIGATVYTANGFYALTNASGIGVFYNLAVGTYRFFAHVTGYHDVNVTSTLHGGPVKITMASSPTIGRTGTGGDVGPCDYFMYLDGTTPVAGFESHKGGTPGDNLVGTAGQDMGAFMNSIAAPGIDYCFGGFTFNFATTWILQTGDNVEGVYNKTLFQPTANSMDVIGITHPTVGAVAAVNLVIHQLSFFTNGHTGINGINLNRSISESATGDDVGFIQYYGGNFNYCTIMDGNEASSLHDIFIGTTLGNTNCEISFKTAGGASIIDNVQYFGAGGQTGCIHTMAQQFTISRSTLNCVKIENQTFSYQGGGSTSWQFTFGELDLKDNFFANGDPSGLHRILAASGESPGVLSMSLIGNYWAICNSNGVLASVGTAAWTINNLQMSGNTFVNCGSTAFWFTKAGGTGGMTMKQLHWDPSNFVSGTFTPGDILTTGLCSAFAIRPEPSGWAPENQPGLPAGTGIGNAVQACETPWPMNVYLTGQSGTHIIDFATTTDTLLSANPTYVTMYPGDKIYFSTTIPSGWNWYNGQW